MSELIEKIKEEGDKHFWEYKGFKCLMRRNVLKCWCGYVEIPIDTPLDFDFESGEYLPINCHGGVTYQELEGDNWVVGFDCAHSGDLVPYLLNNSLNNVYRDKEYVVNEVNNIVEQLLKMKPLRRNLRIDEILGN